MGARIRFQDGRPAVADTHRKLAARRVGVRCSNRPTGRRLWGRNLGGAIGGGVTTYSAGGVQRVAVAAGYTAVLWPTTSATGRIVILGLPDT